MADPERHGLTMSEKTLILSSSSLSDSKDRVGLRSCDMKNSRLEPTLLCGSASMPYSKNVHLLQLDLVDGIDCTIFQPYDSSVKCVLYDDKASETYYVGIVSITPIV